MTKRAERLTVSLPADLAAAVRDQAGDNVSAFVADALEAKIQKEARAVSALEEMAARARAADPEAWRAAEQWAEERAGGSAAAGAA